MGIVGVIMGIAGAKDLLCRLLLGICTGTTCWTFLICGEGGLAIYGGVIGAVIAVFIMARVKRLSPFQIFDTVRWRS